MAPGLRAGREVSATAALGVDVGALESEVLGFAVGEPLEDEELNSAPGGLDSSGQSYLLG